jgi:glutathione S-transferase
VSLDLYYHPLSSFCWKVLIALYENDVPFTPQMVNLGDAEERAAFHRIWPVGKFPVLRDDLRGQTLPESSIIIEYLDKYYQGSTRFIPDDSELALQTRLRDRFYDLYVHLPMQAIVDNRLRPPDAKDPLGVQNARARLHTAYGIIDDQMKAGGWAAGASFSLADCAALPALFYADRVAPLGDGFANVSAYLDRLKARPSVTRVLREAEPYSQFFPTEEA